MGVKNRLLTYKVRRLSWEENSIFRKFLYASALLNHLEPGSLETQSVSQLFVSTVVVVQSYFVTFIVVQGSVAIAARWSAAASASAKTSAGARVARCLRPRFADDDIATLEVGAVQRVGRFFSFLIRAHFDEAETFRPSAKLVSNDPRADHRAMLREVLLEPFLCHVVGEVPNV